jgi:hypothetical protein
MLIVNKLKNCVIKNISSLCVRSFNSLPTVKKSKDEIDADDVSDETWLRGPEARQFFSVIQSNQPCSFIRADSILEYIEKRCDIKFSETNPQLRLCTSLMTHPLTLSFGLNQILDTKSIDNFKVLIIGARSESSLPLTWWHELMYHNSFKNVSIEMIGPDLTYSSHIYKTTFDQLRACSLQISRPRANRLLLHQHEQLSTLLSDSSLFVLFNPGFRSSPLKDKWRNTLYTLLKTGKCLLCTSHSEHDLKRDINFLNHLLHENGMVESHAYTYVIPPMKNSFQSIKFYFDSNEESESKVVASNAYVYCLRLSRREE